MSASADNCFKKLKVNIDDIGLVNCILSLSWLFYEEENHNYQYVIENWMNQIIQSTKNREQSIDSEIITSNIEFLVKNLSEQSMDNINMWKGFKEKNSFYKFDTFSPVGRKNKLYRIYFDLFDASSYQIAEVLQFLEQLYLRFSGTELRSKITLLVDKLFEFIDHMYQSHLDLAVKRETKKKSINEISIPIKESLRSWLSLITFNFDENPLFELLDHLFIHIDDKELSLDPKKVDDYIGIKKGRKIIFFNPFRILRCVYKDLLKKFHSEVSSDPVKESQIYKYVYSYLFELIASVGVENQVLPFPKLVDEKKKTILSSDIGILVDATKIIFIDLVNPVESDYYSNDSKLVIPENDENPNEHQVRDTYKLNLTWEEEGEVTGLNFENIKNLEIYPIKISGLLVTDEEVKKEAKKIPLSFSLWEFRAILSEIDPIAFPIFLKMRTRLPLYTDIPIAFSNELDFFIISKKTGYSFIRSNSEFILLFLDWDIYDWERRQKKVFMLNPKNTNPILSIILKSHKINDFFYQLTSGSLVGKVWIVDLGQTKISILFNQKDKYPFFLLVLRIISYYFSKFNNNILKFLGKLKKRQFTDYYSLEFVIQEIQSSKIILCQLKEERDNTVFYSLTLNINKILELWSSQALNFEVEIISTILSILLTDNCNIDNSSEYIRRFVLQLTHNTRKFYVDRIPQRGKIYSVEKQPLSIPEWARINTAAELSNIINKNVMRDKEITGDELSLFYRELSAQIQEKIENIVFRLPKKQLLFILLTELDFLQEKRLSDRLSFGLSTSKGILEDSMKELSTTMYNHANLSVSLRHAIESVLSSKNPNKIEFYMNYELYYHIVELCSWRVIFATLSDEIFYGLLDMKIHFDSNGKMLVKERMKKISMEVYKETYTKVDIKRALNSVLEMKDKVQSNNEFDKKLDFLQSSVNEAFKLEFGLTVGDLHNIYEKILCYLDENENTIVIQTDELLKLIKSTERIDSVFSDDIVQCFMKNFILESIEHESIEPWKVRSRKNRLIVKPIIKSENNFFLSLRLIKTSQKMIDGILFDGFMPITKDNIHSTVLNDSISALRHYSAKLFEKEVKGITKKHFPIVEESELKNPSKIWEIPQFPQTQFDVFAINPSKKIIIVVEVKDLIQSFDIRELKRELKDFIKKEGFLDKNLYRCEKVKKFLPLILEHYKLPRSTAYEIKGIFVFRYVKIVGFLTHENQTMYCIDEYEEWLETLSK